MQQTGEDKKLQISAFGGWQFNGDITAYSGTLKIDDAASYGAALEFGAARGSTVQLLYIYNSTHARFSSYSALYPSSQKFGVDAHYMQIGGTRGIRRGKVETFGGGTLGAVLVIPDNVTLVNGSTVSTSDTWRFAVTLGGGVKVHVSEKLALRLEGRMLVPMYFSGGGVYVGTGGSGMVVSAGVPAVQGVFTAGLTFSP
jgi:opacity protein-like surface antigen